MRLPWELLVLQSFMLCLADDYTLHGPVFVQEPSDTMFPLDSEEKKVKLSCEVKGNPKPHIRWKLNGTDVDIGMDFRYSVVEGSLLINNPNKTQDAGTYQCIATNSFGTIVSRESKLQFACSPSPRPPGSYYVDQHGLSFTEIHLPLPPEHWD